MPVGGGKFTLEKTWRSAAPSTTTLNASGNFTVPYGKYDISIYGYGGTPIPGNVSGYNDYYNYIFVPATTNPGPVSYTGTISSYQSVNLYGGNPIPGGSYYSGNFSGSGPSCPSPYAIAFNGYPPGNGFTQYTNFSCSPGPPVYTPAYSYGNLVPGNPNYNPSNVANPATLMGATIPGGSTNYSANAVKVNYQNFPSGPAGTSYPATLATGAQMVIVYR